MIRGVGDKIWKSVHKLSIRKLSPQQKSCRRSKRSLIQTIGRDARNINGKAIMYADKETDSIKNTLKTTIERRKKQNEYNKLNNITPTQIKKNIMTTFETKDNVEENNDKNITKIINIDHNISADKRKKIITKLRKDMVKAAKELDFIEAARLRDLITSYKKSG